MLKVCVRNFVVHQSDSLALATPSSSVSAMSVPDFSIMFKKWRGQNDIMKEKTTTIIRLACENLPLTIRT